MWQGTGCGLDPLRVTVPTLTGDDLQPGGELALFDPPLLEGDRVWLLPIEGGRDDLARHRPRA